jgi:cupin 2 domain-containing protein
MASVSPLAIDLTAPMALIVELLTWVEARPRTYGETMDAWRTSCPRMPVWEDAVDNELVAVAPGGPGIAHQVVCLTARGRALLVDRTRPGAKISPDAESRMPGSIDDCASAPETGERHEEIARIGNVTVERITSSALPDCGEYDQAFDEWVMLVRGRARLEVAGEVVSLNAGDHVLLPRHTKHRVLETTAGALWLAVHVH